MENLYSSTPALSYLLRQVSRGRSSIVLILQPVKQTWDRNTTLSIFTQAAHAVMLNILIQIPPAWCRHGAGITENKESVRTVLKKSRVVKSDSLDFYAPYFYQNVQFVPNRKERGAVKTNSLDQYALYRHIFSLLC